MKDEFEEISVLKKSWVYIWVFSLISLLLTLLKTQPASLYGDQTKKIMVIKPDPFTCIQSEGKEYKLLRAASALSGLPLHQQRLPHAVYTRVRNWQHR